MDATHLLAKRLNNVKTNAIREILKAAATPGVISLAGGVPSPLSFPLNEIAAMTQKVIAQYGAGAFQYDVTEGFQPLKEALASHLAARDMPCMPDQLIIFSGSQSALDALGKTLITQGDVIAVESPTYLGALQAFNPYGPHYVQIETDRHGIIPEKLKKALSNENIKFIYTIPTFQNPSGQTITLARRKKIVELARCYGTIIIEDDPYSDLRYRGRALPSLKALAPDNVIYVSTLSKTFAPGLRLGFCLPTQGLHRWLVRVKQGNDLHTSTFNQALGAEYLSSGLQRRHLPKILKLYGPRQVAMLSALDAYFPESFTWSRPEGGMFIWVEGPAEINIQNLYRKALDRGIAFVPGEHFYAIPGNGSGAMRLNFTMVDEVQIDRAIKELATIIKRSHA